MSSNIKNSEIYCLNVSFIHSIACHVWSLLSFHYCQFLRWLFNGLKRMRVAESLESQQVQDLLQKVTFPSFQRLLPLVLSEVGQKAPSVLPEGRLCLTIFTSKLPSRWQSLSWPVLQLTVPVPNCFLLLPFTGENLISTILHTPFQPLLPENPTHKSCYTKL